MKNLFASCALGVALSLATAGVTQAENKLSSRALHSLFPGNFHGVVQGLVDIAFTAKANGRLYGKIMGKTDHGRWKISRGQLCIALVDLTDGKYQCSAVQRNGQWFHVYHGRAIRFRKL